MSKKIIKYSLITIVVALVGYNSVYFKQLDAVKKETAPKLNISDFAKTFYETKLIAAMDSATEMQIIVQLLESNNAKGLEALVKNKNTGNLKYLLVKGKGTISAIEDNVVIVQDGVNVVAINTDIISGSAIRDVTGVVKLNDFDNSTAYNEVSNSINKYVFANVVTPLKQKIRIGTNFNYIGCMEIKNMEVKIKELKIIPLKIN